LKTKSEFILKVEGIDNREAKSIINALKPDNVDLGNDSIIKLDVQDDVLYCKLNSIVKLTSLTSIIDDILRCFSISERSLDLIKSKKKHKVKFTHESL